MDYANAVDEPAMMQYRVELHVAEKFASAGPPAFDRKRSIKKKIRKSREVSPAAVGVFDRSGAEVLRLSFPDTPAANEAHDRIVDDLIRMQVGGFREKYGITAPFPASAPSTAAGSAPPEASPAAADPAGAHFRMERARGADIDVEISPFTRRLLDFAQPGELDRLIDQTVKGIAVPQPALPPGWEPAREPLMTSDRDLIRLVDRAGYIVFVRHQEEATENDRLEAELVRDLSQMDVSAFRAKYGL